MRVTPILTIIFTARLVSAGGNDWVEPSFVLKKSGSTNAQKTITSYAGSSAKKGPWTVYGGGASILPPNGDKLDYLSWAPYHWPDCNWCQSGRAQVSTGGNRTTPDGITGNSTLPIRPEDGGDVEYGDDDGTGGTVDDGQSDDNGRGEDTDINPISAAAVSVPFELRKMIKRRRSLGYHPQRVAEAATSNVAPSPTSLSLLPVPTVAPDDTSGSTTSSGDVFSASQTGVEAAKTTTNQKEAATKTKTSSGTCTPSPTKSLAPSATWTTCKYVVRDGKVNPDVRELHGVQAIADATQSIIYNVMANVLTGSASYAQSAANAINVFFLDATSGMHPRIPYGQVIRGPGKQTGQYLGVLDFRGMVKVANAVLIMQDTKAAAWTSALNSKMQDWSSRYVNWLQTSAIGKKAIAAPNNHGTFAANQLGAMNILTGDKSAAGAALKSYFNGQFQDQIAASGEQPFEAIRTRPFHYRCFNLEAMITNAKLGDQLGLNFWTTKSKYGATIKTALDFVMAKGPGKEDISDAFPHVAAVAAVYGDPGGKYTAYLKKNDPHYLSAPYYYYDQSGAFTQNKEALIENEAEWLMDSEQPFLQETFDANDTQANALPGAAPSIPFECPPVFATAKKVQLDDGIYVTCDQLKPFFGYVNDTESNV